MIRSLVLAMMASAAVSAPALADEYIEYPLDTPCYPFQRSYLTGQAVAIPPYRHVFPIRTYTTPQQSPYYNVPPYPVIAPY